MESTKFIKISDILIITFGVLLLLLLAFSCNAQVIVSWDRNTENDLAGYKVYIVVDVGDTTDFLIDYLPVGKYQFTVSAYDTAGNESDLPKKIKHEIVNCVLCHKKQEF